LDADCQKYETAEEAYRAVQKFDGLVKKRKTDGKDNEGEDYWIEEQVGILR